MAQPAVDGLDWEEAGEREEAPTASGTWRRCQDRSIGGDMPGKEEDCLLLEGGRGPQEGDRRWKMRGDSSNKKRGQIQNKGATLSG